MADKNVTRQLSIYINDKEVVNSLAGIGREIGSVSARMRTLNKDSETYDEDLQKLKGTLEDLKTRHSYLKDEIYGTDQALGSSMHSLEGVEKRMQELSKEMRLLDANSEDYIERLQAMGDEYMMLEDRQKKYRDVISATTKLQVKQVNSLSAVEAEMQQVRAEMSNLDRDSAEYREELARLQGEYSGLQARQQEFQTEINGTTEAVEENTHEMGAAREAWGNLLTGLSTGNLSMAATGLQGIKAGILATTAAARAFIMTPIGIAITAFAGIALATKEWFQYNQEAAKANQETAAITKLSGDALNNARVTAQTLSKTFDQDFNEVLSTASALVSEFDITFDEAFERIEQGLIKGGAANGEFLESMREYPTFFAQAGYSAEEFQNLINTGIDLSIYQDKLPDAIKEFALSITEQTPAVRDALVNAFGEEFSDTLLKGVKSGSVSVKDALVQISDEAKRLGLNSQQAQQLTADLFRGAGEDAGGAVKIFNAVSQSIENQKRPLSEVEQATQNLLESELALAEAQDSALKSDGFEIWKNRALIALNSVYQAYYEVVAFITNSNDELEAMANKNANGKIIKENSAAAIREFESYLKKMQAAAGKNFNLEEATKSYVSLMQDSLKRAIAEKDTLEADSIRAEIKAIQGAAAKRMEVTNKFNIDDINARKKAADTKLKELKAAQDREAKENMRQLEAWSEAWVKADAEISALITKSQTDRTVGQLTGLQKELAQIEAKWATEREKYKDHLDRLAAIDAEKDAELQAAKAAKAKEYGLQIDQINAELERDREALRLDKLASEAVEEEDKQAILLEKAQFLADWELQTEMDKELAKVEAVENAEELKQAIRDKYAQKKQSNDLKFGETEKAIRKDQVKFTDMTEKQKYAFITSNLNNISEAFNKGSVAWKALKIAETTISTFQTSQEAFRGMVSAFPGPVGIALGAAAATAAGIKGLKQVQAISKTKLEKAPKFFKGGPTGDKVLFPDEYGGAVGVVHKNEWVAPEYMTKDPRYANVIGWLENERVRNNGYASGGRASAPGTAADVIAGASEGGIMNELLSAVSLLNSLLQSGIKAETNIGYKQVKDIDTLRTEMEQSNRNGTLNS